MAKASQAKAEAPQSGPTATGHLRSNEPTKSQEVQTRKQAEYVSGAGSLPDYARLMADPVNGPLVGRPDSNAFKTNVARIVDVFDVTTTADGSLFMNFGAHVSGSNYVAPPYTAPNFTAVGTPSSCSLSASILADNQQYRVLTWCGEWIPTMSEIAATGRVIMLTQPTPAFPLNVADLFDEEGEVAHASKPMAHIVRHYEESGFEPSSTGAAAIAAAFPNLLIAGRGLPVGVLVGQVKITRVIEAIPNTNTVARGMAMHTVCDPHACCLANNLVHAQSQRASGDGAYGNIVKNGLSVLRTVASGLTGYSPGTMIKVAKMLNSVL